MKTLLVMRHAKSDWHAEFGGDHERPLNARGRSAAACIGRFLARAGQVPDRVLCSTAVRARTTVELASEAGDWKTSVEHEAALYETWPESVLEIVRAVTDEAESVLLAGHEPTWSSFTSRCVGSARLRFPTAALARIDFAADRWADVDFGLGQLVFFVTPKLIGPLEA